MRRLVALAAFVAFAFAGPASGHTSSESYSNWMVDGSTVHMTFSMSDAETGRLSDVSQPAIIRYLTRRETVTAAGAACPLALPPHAVAAVPGYKRFECPLAEDVVL